MYRVVFALQHNGQCRLCKATGICCVCDACAAVTVGAKHHSFSEQIARHVGDFGRPLTVVSQGVQLGN